MSEVLTNVHNKNCGVLLVKTGNTEDIYCVLDNSIYHLKDTTALYTLENGNITIIDDTFLIDE